MKTHTLLEHTADVRLSLKADTLKELFEAALEGMAELLKENVCKNKNINKDITLSLDAPNTTLLLIDFLSEVLTQTHINRTVYCVASFQILDEKRLIASLQGIPVDHFDEDIKSVTYHEAEIIQNKEGIFETTIVFDI